ncbi:MAG: OmpA family protein [Bacteroidetes bacterium]|jgi:outer membrane protein OmpA-like peptidoglycan-associated protein|nr:OmpA family protein [Bacteroidota bacterium]
MKKILCFILVIFLVHLSFSQTATKGKPISGDCKKAIPLTISNRLFYGITDSLKGYGDVQEIKKGNHLLFEGEHNSAWYLLTFGRDGEMIFDITPADSTNDYDFLLYPYTDSTFCENFRKNQNKPLRSNLSNVKRSVRGITGLARAGELKPSIGKGIGNAYSNSLSVKKGEKYMLILDNVTPNGKGHTLEFNFIKDVEIKGRILNSDSIPVIADITISNVKGQTVLETKTNTNGEYSIKTSLNENQNYTVIATSDSTFVDVRTINTKELKKDQTIFPEIKMVLPKLKKGSKYKMESINFYGNISQLLPSSLPSVEALYRLMKKNKKMVILIEGHVNDQGSGDKGFIQALSDDRAKTVYNYLVKKGINKERMSTIGLANKFQLFPRPKTESEMQANRRVEIKVISID